MSVKLKKDLGLKDYLDLIAKQNEAIIDQLMIDLNAMTSAFRLTSHKQYKDSIKKYTIAQEIEKPKPKIEDFKGKYLDIYDKVRNDNSKDKDSILNDVDFEIELVHRDEITLYYILSLIKQLVRIDSKVYAKKRKALTNLLTGDVNLRSKKELIEKFIDDTLNNLEDGEEIEEAFQSYWGEEKLKALTELCEEENLDKEKIQSIVDEYLFANQVVSFNQKIDGALLTRETLLKRKKTIDRVKERILSFMEIYIEGIAA